MDVKSPFLCIDPGINIGMALFYNEFTHPPYTKLIQAKQSGNWELNHQVVLLGFKYEVSKLYNGNNGNKCSNVYIEKPKFMESHFGLTAARSESLFKLISIYGAMVYILREIGYTINQIDVNWKGQLDKKKLHDRLARKHNIVYPEHIADAVGIGLHVKGIF